MERAGPRRYNKRAMNTTTLLTITPEKADIVLSCYIAFDFETTGFSNYNDRIIEIGAVYFENGVPVKTFGTLVNPGMLISPAASSVNGITDAMVEDAPNDEQAAAQFADFLGEAMMGNIPLVAHNAKFDLGFLLAMFKRHGYDCDLRSYDTMAISRSYLSLESNKQNDVAAHFGLVNENAHRALDDALTCGKIFACLLPIVKTAKPKAKKKSSYPWWKYR